MPETVFYQLHKDKFSRCCAFLPLFNIRKAWMMCDHLLTFLTLFPPRAQSFISQCELETAAHRRLQRDRVRNKESRHRSQINSGIKVN